MSAAAAHASLCALLGIELPIIQAPMAGVQGSAPAIAVCAAGGLGSLPCAMLDAAGVRAAFALGAAGVQVGTSDLPCPEADTGACAGRRSAARARHTAPTKLRSGRPVRGIVTRRLREFGLLNAAVPAFPLAAAAIAPLRAAAEGQGGAEFSPLWAGRNTSGCKAIPAAARTRELASGVPQR